jgi:hypothetical protein
MYIMEKGTRFYPIGKDSYHENLPNFVSSLQSITEEVYHGIVAIASENLELWDLANAKLWKRYTLDPSTHVYCFLKE